MGIDLVASAIAFRAAEPSASTTVAPLLATSRAFGHPLRIGAARQIERQLEVAALDPTELGETLAKDGEHAARAIGCRRQEGQVDLRCRRLRCGISCERRGERAGEQDPPSEWATVGARQKALITGNSPRPVVTRIAGAAPSPTRYCDEPL